MIETDGSWTYTSKFGSEYLTGAGIGPWYSLMILQHVSDGP